MLFSNPEEIINEIYRKWMKEERIKYAKDKCDLCLIQEDEGKYIFQAYKTGAALCQEFDKGKVVSEDTYLIIDREKEMYCVEKY